MKRKEAYRGQQMVEIKFILVMDNFIIAKSSKIPTIQTDQDINS
jgi:hypothetical protein